MSRVIWSVVISLERGDLGDFVEVGVLAAGLGGSEIPDGEVAVRFAGSGVLDGHLTVGLDWASAFVVSEAAFFGDGAIGLVWTPLLRTSAKDLRGEVSLYDEAAMGLVWIPLLIISDKVSGFFAEGAIGLV